jgi:hypothetical protein
MMKHAVPKSLKRAGVVAVLAGLILVASGVVSGSFLLIGLGYLDNYFGSNIGPGQVVLQYTILILTFLVGLGGISVIFGGALLLRKHGTLGRFLIGLGGGGAIFGLLFAMAEAIYVSGFSAPIFYQPFFTLYWIGAILATVSIFMSRRDPTTKPII